jgi:hypothetical protein
VILIKGNQQVNTRNGEWLGLHGQKFKFLSGRSNDYELIVIEVDKWVKMSEEEKYTYLY